MLNPYYYFFYLFYKLLRPIAKYEDRIPLTITTILFILIILHLFIIRIVLEKHLGLQFEILQRIDGRIFGITAAIIHFTLTYFLLERNKRYKLIIEKNSNSKLYKKITTGLFLVLYFSSPLIIYLIAR